MKKTDFQLLSRMFGLVASEQRSFVYNELLEPSQMVTSELTEKANRLPDYLKNHEGFSDVINYWSIYDMCVYSLCSLGLSKPVEIAVEVADKGGVKNVKAWRAVKDSQFEDVSYFCLQELDNLNEDLGLELSMHNILGNFVHGVEPASAAMILHELDKTQLTNKQIQSNLKKEHITYESSTGLMKMLRRLSNNGLVSNLMDDRGNRPSEKAYHIVEFKEDLQTDHRRVSAKSFNTIYQALTNYYKAGDYITMSKFQDKLSAKGIVQKDEWNKGAVYSFDTIHRVFKSLKRQGVLESGYPMQFIPFEITDTGSEVTKRIINPIIKSVDKKISLGYDMNDVHAYWGRALKRFSKG